MRLQHGAIGGLITIIPINPPSTLAHTPSSGVLIGQMPIERVDFGGVGIGQEVLD